MWQNRKLQIQTESALVTTDGRGESLCVCVHVCVCSSVSECVRAQGASCGCAFVYACTYARAPACGRGRGPHTHSPGETRSPGEGGGRVVGEGGEGGRARHTACAALANTSITGGAVLQLAIAAKQKLSLAIAG